MNPYLILPTLKSYLCGKKRLETNHYYVLRKPTELSAALDCQRITIQYHPKNEKEKNN